MTLPLSSTIVGDNTANGKRNDLAQIQEGVDDPGGFRLTNSLVEVPGNAEITQAPNGASVLGRDPQLGRLANNGGPTPTQLPEITSPAIDTGRSNGLVADQRRLRRTVDLNVPNGKGDGTDMGAVELQSGAISHTRRLEADEVPNGCDVAYDGPGERLAGDGTSQTIRGTSDPDILLGNGGDDRLLGLASGDCLAGGNGEDLVKGNRGADLILGRREADELFGGAGGDVIRSGTGDDRSSGGAGGDTISGGPGDDTLRGMAGDDVISVGSGADDVSCGPGDDTVRGVTRNDTIADNCEHIHRRFGS
jgi:Ca2+-binding RTX toxin-like protein